MPPTPNPYGSAHAPRWERRKESRPAELLAAALELFVERGYAATRLDDIASRAGVSKGTLYLYFSNKHELFEALVRETIVPKLEQFRAEIEASEEPAAELVERFVRTWWREFGATRLSGIAKLVMAEAGNFPEVARFFHDEVVQPNGRLLVSVLERGVRAGEFRPIDVETAAHLWVAPLVMKAMWSHSFDLCRIAGTSPEPETMIAVHVELIRAALAPRRR